MYASYVKYLQQLYFSKSSTILHMSAFKLIVVIFNFVGCLN